jgi:hypothetical protein
MTLNEVIRENCLHTFEAQRFIIFTNFLIGFIVRAVKLESPCTIGMCVAIVLKQLSLSFLSSVYG